MLQYLIAKTGKNSVSDSSPVISHKMVGASDRVSSPAGFCETDKDGGPPPSASDFTAQALMLLVGISAPLYLKRLLRHWHAVLLTTSLAPSYSGLLMTVQGHKIGTQH
jgi:hypothetical protein